MVADSEAEDVEDTLAELEEVLVGVRVASGSKEMLAEGVIESDGDLEPDTEDVAVREARGSTEGGGDSVTVAVVLGEADTEADVLTEAELLGEVEMLGEGV